VTEQGRAGRLPFEVQKAGSHWSREAQVDVVGVHWAEKAILLGECKTPQVLKALPDEGQGWAVHYAFFARAGFTDAARQEAKSHSALLVDLNDLDRGLI
jgi:hypothetical protein